MIFLVLLLRLVELLPSGSSVATSRPTSGVTSISITDGERLREMHRSINKAVPETKHIHPIFMRALYGGSGE